MLHRSPPNKRWQCCWLLWQVGFHLSIGPSHHFPNENWPTWSTCGLILSRVQAVHSNAGLICLLMPCTPWVIVCQPFLTLCLNNVTDIDCLGTKKLSIAWHFLFFPFLCGGFVGCAASCWLHGLSPNQSGTKHSHVVFQSVVQNVVHQSVTRFGQFVCGAAPILVEMKCNNSVIHHPRLGLGPDPEVN